MGVRIAIPAKVRAVLLRLQENGFAAYAVGGCVRDSLLGQSPADWDICTNARPEETAQCFDRCVLTGAKYGTVTVLEDGEAYEITTFRAETGYADSRHPDAVQFLPQLEGDLSRRDFTVNAMAADANGRVTDLFGGMEDLQNKCIRCVGNAAERFSEDALRILRALRFASRLGFEIEPQTAASIHSEKDGLTRVAAERLRKELSGLLVGQRAAALLEEYADVLCLLLPELQPCVGFLQHNPHHKYDVFRHSLRVVEHTPQAEVLRLAALLHDMGKPSCFFTDEAGIGHFYGHEEESAKLCRQALHRLRYDNHTVDYVTKLVEHHDFFAPTPKSLRRLLAKLGEPLLRDLLTLRRADALGTGVAEESQVEAQIGQQLAWLEEILTAERCLSLKDLAIHGDDLLSMGIPQGRQVGQLLQWLFDEVMEERIPNEREALVNFIQELKNKSENC